MDISDKLLWLNRDWDPVYLASVFQPVFFEFKELWNENISEMELVEAAKNVEKYCPLVEDISMEDSELCSAVESIENE